MRVLVTAASRHGSTAEIADALAAQLVRCGLDVTVEPPDGDADPAEYDAVVLGSAVYAGRWLDAARRFAGALVSAATAAGLAVLERAHRRSASARGGGV